MLVVSMGPSQLHCASADVSAHFYVTLLSPEKQQKKAGDHRKAGIEPVSAALDHISEKGSESAKLL